MTIDAATIKVKLEQAQLAVQALEEFHQEVPPELLKLSKGETWKSTLGMSIQDFCQVASICAAHLEEGAGTHFHSTFNGNYVTAYRGEKWETIFLRYSYEAKLSNFRGWFRDIIADEKQDDVKSALEIVYDKLDRTF